MTEQDLLAQMLDRLARSESMQELFGADEIAEWPAGAFDVLVEAGLLRPASPAHVLTCTGCEQYCSMPVNSIPAVEHHPARVFIACDKRDDVGRVPVDAVRLRQWQVSGAALAELLVGALKLDRPPQHDSANNRWVIGTIKGAKHKASVALTLDGRPLLVVAGHNMPLADVVRLTSGTLAVDRSELVRCTDNPIGEPGSHRYQPSAIRREAGKLGTQQQYEAWRREARKLRTKSSKPSDRWVSQQIARMPMAQGASAETIRKRIRK